VNTIRTYFLGFWSKLKRNEKPEEQPIVRPYISLADQLLELNQTRSIKKTRRTSKQHMKIDKQVQKVIENDYCHTKKSHQISQFCKNLLKK
jgi:hypothetical protein